MPAKYSRNCRSPLRIAQLWFERKSGRSTGVRCLISAWFTIGRQSSVATVPSAVSSSVHVPVPSKSFSRREWMRRGRYASSTSSTKLHFYGR